MEYSTLFEEWRVREEEGEWERGKFKVGNPQGAPPQVYIPAKHSAASAKNSSRASNFLDTLEAVVKINREAGS
jgi:hypothetical protein